MNLSALKAQARQLQKAAELAAKLARDAQRVARHEKLRARIFDTLIGRGSYTVIAPCGFAALAHLASKDEINYPWREGIEYHLYTPTDEDDVFVCADAAAEMILAIGDDK